ncbi:MAG: MBL fold metallo-hydrolase [Alistipes sp.]|nr:MBL fold metallo-hydrolase [Alistipes sp.]
MRLTLLGTGTSQGVPVIGCRCEVCQSADWHDKRLRTSAMVECDDMRIVIDAGPDFRQQMLRTGVRQIDAILLTHEHKDHTGGLDDVRAFNFVDYPIVRPIDIYATEHTTACVRRDFGYAFVENKYIGAPEMRLHAIATDQPFTLNGREIIPINGRHSERFNVTGYRIGKMAYLTDFKELMDGEVEKLKGVDTLVVNALRFMPHHSHFSVDEALALIDEVKPRVAYLTHLSHDIGLHAETSKQLPEGVFLGYDTLTIDIEE